MESFYSLPEGKQKNVRDAALKMFGESGYQKTSVKDISDTAEISKSMIFYYFGSKKDLYLYLVNYCSQVLTSTLANENNQLPEDYFERMKVATVRQMSNLKNEPFILPFLMTMISETNPEVSTELTKYRVLASSFQNDYAFKDVDLSKFKDDVNPKIVLKMMLWMAEGFSKNISFNSDVTFQKSVDEFTECLDLLRKNLYKEEFI